MEKKILNVGVIGLGMGKAHAEGVTKTEGACLYAVCDINKARADEVAKELSAAHVFTDYRDMIADPAIDAVIIASPDQDHRQMILDSLAAGKHILCEKPLAFSREDCVVIVDAVKKSDKIFMVGQICRYTPGFKQAKEIIESGAIGELTFVESEYAHDYSHIYAGGSWRSDPVRNGGVGGGCHAVDLLRWYAGDPLEVFAYGAHKLLPEVSYDDATISVLKFPNGVIGKVFVSTGCKRPYTMRTQLFGTKGTILCDNTSDHMTLYVVDKDGVDLAEPQTIPIEIKNHNAGLEFEVFAKTIENDEPVAMDGVQGAKTIACCLAIVESAKTGKPVAPNYNF